MLRLFGALAFAWAVAACATEIPQDLTPVTASDAHIAQALADPGRPAGEVERDAFRHPGEIVAFAQVRPGDRVVDVGPGAGYYTRIFSRAVGPYGSVVAVIRTPPADAQQRPRIYEVAENPAYTNVSVVQGGYMFTLEQPADVIFVSQIYHDFYIPLLSLDVPALNRALFAALKPGGRLVVIDHSAAPGSPVAETAQALHRIDEEAVKRDLAAAGFVFEADTQVLRNPDDDRSVRVFEGAIRGHTDQFVLRFRRP